jgi:hypothetical protein
VREGDIVEMVERWQKCGRLGTEEDSEQSTAGSGLV